MKRNARAIFVLALVGLWVTACNQDPFNAVVHPDGVSGVLDAGPDGDIGLRVDALDGGGIDGDACVRSDSGVEICNDKDDDCNGKVDDVASSLLQSDVKHCGKCKNACSYQNAFAKCTAGVCSMDTCAPGYYDVNQLSSDGCEYACVPSNNGTEKCDGLDNDCDGKKDEDFNLNTDINNCGACGNACAFANAAASCSSGSCTMGACNTGFADIDTLAATGCEYKCPVYPPEKTEVCDGKDNTCDGKVDLPYTGTACGSKEGECVQGTTQCIGGKEFCLGTKGPFIEKCNGKDDDCDTKIDEDFDTLNDPRYCDGCKGCAWLAALNAIPECDQGTCKVLACATGYVDLDKKASNGCEYKCTNSGVEICDGADNDCDGKTDTDSAGNPLVPPGNLCLSRGPCAGASATCQGKTGWVCNYSSDVELVSCTKDADCLGYTSCVSGVCPGLVAPSETLCDGKDNDCDGKADDTFTTLNSTCYEQGKQGICQGTGKVVCNSQKTGVECTITTPGSTATDELCNGLDDDCDGKIDEEADDAAGKGVKDDMVRIDRPYGGKVYTFYIYTYEASRPDASINSAGSKTTRACSKTNVIPWANVDFDEAKAACQAAGKRLCTPTEWFLACSGAPTTSSSGRAYPYGNTYVAGACNGKDKYSNKDELGPTGDLGSCVSHDKVMDMSGNLREWTDDPNQGASQPEPVRGGAYDTVEGGLRCDFTFVVLPKNFYYANLGFRCCSDKAP